MNNTLLKSASVALSSSRVLAAAVASSIVPAATSWLLSGFADNRGVYAIVALISLVSSSLGILFASRAAREPLVASGDIVRQCLSSLPLLMALVAAFYAVNMLAMSLQNIMLSAVPTVASSLASSGVIGISSGMHALALLFSLPAMLIPVWLLVRMLPLPLLLTYQMMSVPQVIKGSMALTRGRFLSLLAGFILPLFIVAFVADLAAASAANVFQGGQGRLALNVFTFLSRLAMSSMGVALWAGVAVVLEDKSQRRC